MIIVSKRTLLRRINRRLLPQREAVLPYGPLKQHEGFYRIDIRLNAMIEETVDVEQLARELGVLSESEHLAD
jgi:hypothetical protein